MSKQKKKSANPIGFYNSLISQIKTDKPAFTVFLILRLFVIIVIVRSAFEGRYECVFTGILALTLFLLPPFVEKSFRIELPTVFEIIVFLFIFCAEILGEIEGFYVKYSFWDTMLHTINGFMFAAFGFCLVDIFNRNPRFKFQLSPFFLAFMAFCFSMTIGVLWEFFEFSMDKLFCYDMQKDFIINSFGSVYLDPSGGNASQVVRDIEETIIITSDGVEHAISGGYLDVGITDTMKDLFVNFVGAVLFSIVGFFYIKQRGKGVIASQFIPVFKANEDAPGQEKVSDQDQPPEDETNNDGTSQDPTDDQNK